MSNTELLEKISLLPEDLKNEAADFIDFLLQKKMNSGFVHPKAGCLKGIFIIQQGFDEPLEDFKDYQ